jgi:hypothetical protein
MVKWLIVASNKAWLCMLTIQPFSHSTIIQSFHDADQTTHHDFRFGVS